MFEAEESMQTDPSHSGSHETRRKVQLQLKPDTKVVQDTEKQLKQVFEKGAMQGNPTNTSKWSGSGWSGVASQPMQKKRASEGAPESHGPPGSKQLKFRPESEHLHSRSHDPSTGEIMAKSKVTTATVSDMPEYHQFSRDPPAKSKGLAWPNVNEPFGVTRFLLSLLGVDEAEIQELEAAASKNEIQQQYDPHEPTAERQGQAKAKKSDILQAVDVGQKSGKIHETVDDDDDDDYEDEMASEPQAGTSDKVTCFDYQHGR